MCRAALALALAASCVARDAAAASPQDPAIVLRIHDYVGLSADAVARTQEVVTSVYGAIGVGTRWSRTMRHRETGEDGREATIEAGELSLLVLNRQMARQRAFSSNTVGLAAMTLANGGTIAYVVFDRVRSVARAARRSAAEAMGFVMAHEIAHLLLPFGSHTATGLMRPCWEAGDLRRDRQERLAFGSAEAEAIRQRVSHLAAHLEPEGRHETSSPPLVRLAEIR